MICLRESSVITGIDITCVRFQTVMNYILMEREKQRCECNVNGVVESRISDFHILQFETRTFLLLLAAL